MERDVRFTVNNTFYEDPPSCVTVLPSKTVSGEGWGRTVEKALARHLTQKVARVITPLERSRLERNEAWDLEDKRDRRRFALRQRCPAFAQAFVKSMDDDYMVIWTEKRVAMAIRLTRASDDALLWQAEHAARRGDGGVPLSPISVATSAAMAGKFNMDKDVTPSLIDDGLRRIMVTLPDTR